MRSKILVVAATAVSGLLIPSGFAATPDLAKTRSALEQWVEFRKLISEEQNNWRVEQEIIRESVDLITSEIARIESDLERLEAGATEADKERGRLNDDNNALKTAASAVSSVIADLEAKVASLHASFPTDLKTKVQPLFVRIPKPGAATRASVGERLQNVVGILSEVEKFNRTITIVSEMQKMPSGETAQVRTIYLGLGVAYFTDEAGTYGGVLTPSPAGWQATENSAIAPAIRRAIGVYTNDVLAEFVQLPIEVK